MTTVLCIPGAFSFGNIVTCTEAFGGPQQLLAQLGEPTTATNLEVVAVRYNDWDAIGGYLDGANKLNAALLDVVGTGNIVVVGHSFGAVSVCQWLRQYGTTSAISTSRVKFVLIGNSCRPQNGLCGLFNMYGGPGPDVTTSYTVIDCARQWDKWADYPNLFTNADEWIATANVFAGDSAPYNIHVSYQDIDASNPGASVTMGNVTFQLFETTPIPLGPSYSRSQIEPAYNRIVGYVPW
jgi:pimeloyl-ACP methyl ester carboxylesterase